MKTFLLGLFAMVTSASGFTILRPSSELEFGNKMTADKFPTNITVAFLFQNSRDLISSLLSMTDLSSQVVDQLKALPKEWVERYEFWSFNAKEFDYETKTPFADDLPIELKDLTSKARNQPYACKDLLIIDTLISALTSSNKGTQVFLYVYGGLKRDEVALKKLYQLIDEKQAKIHAFQSSLNRCYDDYSVPEIATIGEIAKYSGGTYTLDLTARTLLIVPLQYRSEMLYEQENHKCPSHQVVPIQVGSDTQTLTLRFDGDIKGRPAITSPDGTQIKPTELYWGAYEATDLVSAATLGKTELPAGEWKVEYGDFTEGLPCSFRVDVQTGVKVTPKA